VSVANTPITNASLTDAPHAVSNPKWRSFMIKPQEIMEKYSIEELGQGCT